jgi:hypothetical protein
MTMFVFMFIFIFILLTTFSINHAQVGGSLPLLLLQDKRYLTPIIEKALTHYLPDFRVRAHQQTVQNVKISQNSNLYLGPHVTVPENMMFVANVDQVDVFLLAHINNQVVDLGDLKYWSCSKINSKSSPSFWILINSEAEKRVASDLIKHYKIETTVGIKTWTDDEDFTQGVAIVLCLLDQQNITYLNYLTRKHPCRPVTYLNAFKKLSYSKGRFDLRKPLLPHVINMGTQQYSTFTPVIKVDITLMAKKELNPIDVERIAANIVVAVKGSSKLSLPEIAFNRTLPVHPGAAIVYQDLQLHSNKGLNLSDVGAGKITGLSTYWQLPA